MKSLKSFTRSLSYLKPYRRQLIVAVVCVIFISVLWGGGLGMIGPASHVLISKEGLHGWAYNAICGNRLKAAIRHQDVAAGMIIDPGSYPAAVLEVAGVADDGPAAGVGIESGDWIVGIYDGDGQHKLMPAGDLVRTLALAEADSRVVLRVFNPLSREDRSIPLTLNRASAHLRLLGRIVSAIPEPQGPRGRFRIFLALLAVALVMTYLRDLFRFVQEYLVRTAVYRAMMDLRCDNYTATLRMPITFFSQKGTSDTTSRFVQDTNELSRGMITLFGKTLAEPGKAIASMAAAFWFSWELTLIVMLAGPPAFIMINRFGKRMRKASKRALEGWSEVLAVLQETLMGIRVVKAYTMEGSERKRFFRSNRRLYRQQRKMAKIDSATAPAVEALGITAAVGAAALAGYWVLHGRGEMTTSDFIAMMGCLAAMFDPIRKLAKVVTRFQRADAAAFRIFELHDREKEKSLPGAPMLERHSRSIEFANVSFRYPGGADDALKNIDLSIEAGRTVAIVGPNGCGKTTLVSLVPRLIDPTAGSVLIDAKDISKYSMRSLRRQIALVTQDTVIFNATIAENIAYGLRRPKDEDVLAAARKAFVDEFVRDLPDGYDTTVGERGATLSGGQKQRIAIARAIIRDPAILIFDEATSQVDPDSEQRIHQAMEEFVTGRTTLMIAHRFSTVLSADTIVVMNEGRIIDKGTHRELFERCDFYRHLYKTQLISPDG